jgi:hypothetical protein
MQNVQGIQESPTPKIRLRFQSTFFQKAENHVFLHPENPSTRNAENCDVAYR